MLLSKGEITIRDFLIEDIENKVKWINDPENNQFLHYNIPLDVESTKKWFYSKNNNNRIDCTIEYNGVPVGVIGLLQIDNYNKKAEYYITIGDNNYKRKGIAYISSKILINYAFDVLKLKKVYLNVDEKNEIACRLYEKIGFRCEGIFIKDMLFKGEWINRKRYAILNG